MKCVTLFEDEWLHLWVPALALVTKMDTRFEQFRHEFSGHSSLRLLEKMGCEVAGWKVTLQASLSVSVLIFRFTR
jgi:hypothetical protein